ncbi:serine/threonine-protein kinase NIM1-like [Saccoglossus kowalevskii]|uniref:Serine/threonine-protein kinase NIM1-like n=1 Tax=Saccoglossus kowalevskii TaxID=10224 RepID=A0ABM0GPK7_SACKO|nr:PREDICTED: serine/threonine-protein kinase NIM1-like [Saccoglossus kowalevskii]
MSSPGSRRSSGVGVVHRESIENTTTSLSHSEQSQTGENGNTVERARRLTAYERLSHDLSNDQRVIKEITLGKRIGFYRIRGELGSGNFSQVKMGIHALTKEKVAIKILDKTKLDQKTQRLLSREISSMEKLHHPNIIRLYEVVETLAKLHIVMEYAPGGELFAKISNEGKLNETEAKSLYAQVIAAVEHMHGKFIIHRDLKAENVFYATNGLVKIGDFGFSTVCKPGETLNTFCGSPPYAAPELFKDENYIGHWVDVWAMGIMLYFMVTGLMPFRAETVAKLKKCILDGTYTIPSYVSEDCQSLIKSMLKPLPSDRPSLNDMKRSAWLEGIEFPRAHLQYKLMPHFDKSSSAEEIEVKSALKDLGIGEEHLEQTRDKDSRNSITGTYRIILHRIQKKNSEPPLQSPVINDNSRNTKKLSKDQTTNNRGNKVSKFCSIL